MLKYLVSALIALTGIGGTAYYLGADRKEAITFDPQKAQRVEWEKPTTDAEWAEDVKAESFDIKSTGKLEEMRAAHAVRLEKIEKAKIMECQECVRYDMRKDLEMREYKGSDLDAAVDDWFSTELIHHESLIEKLKQSIERMDNELRLREKGFVIVEGESNSFGGSIPPERIRNIND